MRSGSRRRSLRLGVRGNRLAWRDDPGDDLPDRDVSSLGCFDPCQNPVCGSLDFYDGFIGFNFEKGLTFGNTISFFLPPSQKLAGFLCHFESGHYYAEGHSR